MKKSWMFIAVAGLALAFAVPTQAGQGNGQGNGKGNGKGNCDRQGECLQQGQGGCGQGGGSCRGGGNKDQSRRKKGDRDGTCRN